MVRNAAQTPRLATRHSQHDRNKSGRPIHPPRAVQTTVCETNLMKWPTEYTDPSDADWAKMMAPHPNRWSGSNRSASSTHQAKSTPADV